MPSLQGSITITVPANEQLNVSADSVSTGSVHRFAEHPGDIPGVVAIAEGETHSFGPRCESSRYQIDVVTGALSYEVTNTDFVTLTQYQSAAQFSLIGEVGDLYEIIGEGAPVDYTDGSPSATGEGVAGKGSRYTDITNGALYLNTGTKAEPVWTGLLQAS